MTPHPLNALEIAICNTTKHTNNTDIYFQKNIIFEKTKMQTSIYFIKYRNSLIYVLYILYTLFNLYIVDLSMARSPANRTELC